MPSSSRYSTWRDRLGGAPLFASYGLSSRTGEGANKKGSLTAPLQELLLCSSSADGLVVFVERPVRAKARRSPMFGTLRTNGFFWSLICHCPRGLNRFWRCLMAVLSFSARSTGNLSGNSSPKESVCYASTCLFLLCWSRYVLFLLWVLLSCFCCARDKAFGVPSFINPYFSYSYDFPWSIVRTKNGHRRYRAPQASLRFREAVTPARHPSARTSVSAAEKAKDLKTG